MGQSMAQQKPGRWILVHELIYIYVPRQIRNVAEDILLRTETSNACPHI